jgi:hypothetical protein
MNALAHAQPIPLTEQLERARIAVQALVDHDIEVTAVTCTHDGVFLPIIHVAMKKTQAQLFAHKARRIGGSMWAEFCGCDLAWSA